MLASASREYPLLTPAPGWTEQDPERWWQATVAVLQELGRTANVEVVGLGLAGQMHGSVFLDAEDRVIRPALLWNDGRTGRQVEEIERIVGRERLIGITGNAASAGMQAPKILWLRDNEPDAHARLAKVLLPRTSCASGSPATMSPTPRMRPGRCCSTCRRGHGRRNCWRRWTFRPNGCRT